MFGAPKCPRCGQKATPTGYAFPFPPWQCKPCKKDNEEKSELENRVKNLEQELKKNQGSLIDPY